MDEKAQLLTESGRERETERKRARFGQPGSAARLCVFIVLASLFESISACFSL